MTTYVPTEPGERYPPDEYRAVVIKDDPKAWRPWRWVVEEKMFRDWSLIAEGRASSRRIAWRRVHARASSLPHQCDREEATIFSDPALVRSDPPPPVPSPITPEFL